MKTMLAICSWLSFAVSTTAFGHGIPIVLTVDASNKLIVSNPQPLYTPADLTSGYAPMILVDNEDEAVMDHIIVNSSALGLQGPFAFTTLPGFNVTGMGNSSLQLRVISRPVKGSNPVNSRLLWHWSLQNESVAIDPAGESLVILSDADDTVQTITVPQSAGGPLTITVADPPENGVHEHYLEYLLGDSPAADIGAFGFFARLTSPNFTPSEPFLVILDNGMYDSDNPGILLTAALAINNAALLAGDYNHDDVVSSADLALWKSSFGSTTQLAADGNGNGVVDAADYTIWRDHLGLQFSGGGAGTGSNAAVPEPSSLVLSMGFALTFWKWRSRQK